jgi:hypothetical protein
MSWSATAVIVRKTYEPPSVTVTHRQEQADHGAVESKVAIDKALKAATLMTDAMGEGTFDVTLSGHSNPGNKPAQGWANDGMRIDVQQRKA